MKGDIIILNPSVPSPTLAKISFSHGLARSAKLSVLEGLLERYLSSTKRIPTLLLHGKKIHLTRKEILMKLGELLSFRQQLNLSAGESFLDTPDFYWARPELEGKGVLYRTHYSKWILNDILYLRRILQQDFSTSGCPAPHCYPQQKIR